MTCKDFETTILDGDGLPHEYYLHQMPPTVALPLKYKLMKLLGGTVSTLLQEVDMSKVRENKAAALPGLGHAIQNLFVDADPDDTFKLIREILAEAKRDGKEIILDHAYGDNYLEMYMAVAWILRSNYGSFLAGLGQLGGLKKVAPKEVQT